MKLFIFVAAILTIANATSMRQNAMGQQAMGLGILGGQRLMNYEKPMTILGVPMEMQRTNQELLKNSRTQMGICNGPCSRQDMNQNTMTAQARQVQMQQLMNNLNTVSRQAGNMNLEQVKTVAYQMADQMTQQAQQEQQVQMQQSVKQLQQQNQNMMTTGSMVQQMAQQQAVQEIQEDMMKQQEMMNPVLRTPTSEMQQTLQVAIEAQMTLQSVQMQQSVQNPAFVGMAPRVYNFQLQMQQLLTQNNMEKTKGMIAVHECKVQQIQMLLEFVNQQIQQLQIQQEMTQEQNLQPQVMQQIQTAQQQMQQQQQQLMVQLMAQQTVIYQLQQVLMGQQSQQRQQQMSSQQTVEYLTQKYNPMMMMMMSMKMPGMMQA